MLLSSLCVFNLIGYVSVRTQYQLFITSCFVGLLFFLIFEVGQHLLLSPTFPISTSMHNVLSSALGPNILSTGEWRLSCRTNPLVIPVSHDLSVAFYHTKAILVMFSSHLVAISGVALRSFQSFDPITISGCQSNEIYNPTGQR